MKYGLKQLRKDFPTDRACLEFIFETLHTWECVCGGEYAYRDGRKQFQCSKCRAHISPTAGTIFHKSDTPLSIWFHALWVFSNAKSGISAKELQRQIGCTYKTCYRIRKLILLAYEMLGVQNMGDKRSDKLILFKKVLLASHKKKPADALQLQTR